MQKICPLYALGEMLTATIAEEEYDTENTLCDGRMCAWYSDYGKCCALVGVGAALRRPQYGGLNSEVPHD